MDLDVWRSDLESYVKYSGRYPDRIHTTWQNRQEMVDAQELLKDQLGYFRGAKNPVTNQFVVFFENEQDTILAKIIIPGQYRHRVIKEDSRR